MRASDDELISIVEHGQSETIKSVAKELLLLRAECRAARAYKVRHETASLRNTTAAWLNFGESTKVYEITCKATDDAGFAP